MLEEHADGLISEVPALILGRTYAADVVNAHKRLLADGLPFLVFGTEKLRDLQHLASRSL
eukprot:55519-Amphidinium_carterae.2